MYFIYPEMPQRKRREGFIDWRNSEAKAALLKHLLDGVLTLDESEVSAEEAWATRYSNMTEFANVVFEQFKLQLKAHRKLIKEKTSAANVQEAALQHDRRIYPEKTHYESGRPIFRMSPAQSLLGADVRDGRHREMTPATLKSSRPEYDEWALPIFRQRIYQEVRRQKFINYLEWKREESKDKPDGDVNSNYDAQNSSTILNERSQKINRTTDATK